MGDYAIVVGSLIFCRVVSDYPIITPSEKEVNPPHGSCWRISKERFQELVEDNRIWFGEDGDNVPRLKRFLCEVQDGMVASSLMLFKDVGHSQEGRQEVKKLFDDRGYFDGPKPLRLLSRLLRLANTDKDSIILDFFSGSPDGSVFQNASLEKLCITPKLRIYSQ